MPDVDELFQVRASLGRHAFTEPDRVDLAHWPPPREDIDVAVGTVLFPPDSPLRQRLLNALKNARQSDSWLRIVLEFPAFLEHPTPEWVRLVNQPWERARLQISPGGSLRELARLEKVSIVRAIPDPFGHVAVVSEYGVESAPAKPRYRHIDVLSPDRHDSLEATVALLGERFDVEPPSQASQASSINELEQRIRRHSGDLSVLHITGHGSPAGIRVGYADAGRNELRPWLEAVRTRLLLTSVCHSAAADGLVSQLPHLDISAFIGMQEDIIGSVNAAFVETFFRSLADGDSVDEAMWKARDAASREDRDSWWVPVLYLRRDARRSPWFWPPPTAQPQNPLSEAQPVSSPSERRHPELPSPHSQFEVCADSCFIEFAGGLVEVHPGASGTPGLHARRVHDNEGQAWKSVGVVSSVAVDPTGRYVTCVADGAFFFAPVAPMVLDGDWRVATELPGVVSAVHQAWALDNGGVAAVTTIDGTVKRIKVSFRGWCHDICDVEQEGQAADLATDAAHGLTVSLRADGEGRLIVTEYLGESRMFQAPSGAIGVSVVRQHGPDHPPEFVIRTTTVAGLWSAAALSAATVLT